MDLISSLEEQVANLQAQLDLVRQQLEDQKRLNCGNPENVSTVPSSQAAPSSSTFQVFPANPHHPQYHHHHHHGQAQQFALSDSALCTANQPNIQSGQISSQPAAGNTTMEPLILPPLHHAHHPNQAAKSRSEFTFSKAEFRTAAIGNDAEAFNERIEIFPEEKTMPLHFKVENLLRSIREVVQDDPNADISAADPEKEDDETGEESSSTLEKDLLKTINHALLGSVEAPSVVNNDGNERSAVYQPNHKSFVPSSAASVLSSKPVSQLHIQNVEERIPSILFDSIPRALYPSILKSSSNDDDEVEDELEEDDGTSNLENSGLFSTFLGSMTEKYSMASLEYLNKHKLLGTKATRKKDPVARVLDMERLESIYRRSNKGD